LEPCKDSLLDVLRCRDPVLRFLLKDIKHVDGIAEQHGIRGPIRVAVVVLHELHHLARQPLSERSRRSSFHA
jgi:hypothetical protein